MSLIVNVVLLSLLCIILTNGNAYEMRINHNPWWSHKPHRNEVGSSYQYFYPGHSQRDNRQKVNWNNQNRVRNKVRWNNPNSIRDKFHWKYDTDYFKKAPMPAIPTRPPYTQSPRMADREWPSYIPPIRMIKLPLDEPPAAIK